MSSAMTITKSNFQTEVMDSTKLFILDFWAEWCQPCRMLTPILDELAAEYAEKLAVGKLNVDDENALAANFGIFSIPTLLFFKNGEVKEQVVGVQSKKRLKSLIDRHL